MGKRYMELNAAAQLSITGLFKDSRISAHLSRVTVPLDYYTVSDGKYPEPQGAPRRPTSRLPPSERLRIESSLGKQLSHGRCGAVYQLKITRVCSSDGRELCEVLCPPLVAKVAGFRYSSDLTHETWFYDEMETLQGSVIPRCFGLFETTLRDGTTIRPWISHELHKAGAARRKAPNAFEERPVPSPLRLSILLLEELGGEHPPMRKALTPEIEDQILHLVEEFGPFRIVHSDIRHKNILNAPRMPGALPSLPSPYTGRTYDWRIFDFDCSGKCNSARDVGDWLNRQQANMILGGLKQGEPWPDGCI